MNNKGFTLIELIAVMVILAILAVVAVPQFIDLRTQAADASAAGVGGAIASGSALNYARGTSGAGGASEITACDGTQLDNVIGGVTSSTAGTMVLNGRTYNIATITAPTGTGTSGTCTIEDTVPAAAVPQTFTIIACTPAATC